MIKVAVAGLGTMGMTHLDAWLTIPGVEIVAVCGRNAEKAERVAKQYHAKAFSSFEEMCERAHFDAVDICLPTHLHPAYIRAAALAGKHIICEKPLALDPQEAKTLIDLCEQAGVKLLVGHALRFCPEYRQARDQVVQGKLGRVGVVRMSRRTRYPAGAGNWFADAALSGGVIMDLLIHDLDWLHWTFGPAVRVTALRVERSHPTEAEYALLAVKFECGTIAHVEGSWAHTDFRSSFEIAGTEGMIVEDGMESAPLLTYRHSKSSETQGVIVPETTLARNPYELELEHFAACILNDAEPIVTAQDALYAVELADAAIASAKSGQPIWLGNRGEGGE